MQHVKLLAGIVLIGFASADVGAESWKARLDGPLMRDFPSGDIREGEVALVAERGRVGYVFTKHLKKSATNRLYELKPLKPTDVRGYFRKGPHDLRAGFGGNTFTLKVSDNARHSEGVYIHADGTVHATNSAQPIPAGKVKAVFPDAVTDWRPGFKRTFGSPTCSLPFFAAIYNERTNRFDYAASIEAMAGRIPYKREEGVVAGLLFYHQHGIGGYSTSYQTLGGSLLLEVSPDGSLVYRQGLTHYPTYLDGSPTTKRATDRYPDSHPFRAAPGIVTWIQLFDSKWYFDEEHRAFLYSPQKYKPMTGRELAKFTEQDHRQMQEFVRSMATKVGKPQMTWDNLSQQEKLEICRSYLHKHRQDAEKARRGWAAMAIAALAYGGANAAAGVATETVRGGSERPGGKPKVAIFGRLVDRSTSRPLPRVGLQIVDHLGVYQKRIYTNEKGHFLLIDRVMKGKTISIYVGSKKAWEGKVDGRTRVGIVKLPL